METKVVLCKDTHKYNYKSDNNMEIIQNWLFSFQSDIDLQKSLKELFHFNIDLYKTLKWLNQGLPLLVYSVIIIKYCHNI